MNKRGCKATKHGPSLKVTLPIDWCRGHAVGPGTRMVAEYNDDSVTFRVGEERPRRH